MGRPSDYSQETAAKICGELAQGRSLKSIVRADDMPCEATVFNWLKAFPEFLEQYARAKEESADALADELLDIADDAAQAASGDIIQGARLRIDTRKWIASKLKPKKYGEKVTHEGSTDKPFRHVLAFELADLDAGPDQDPPEA